MIIKLYDNEDYVYPLIKIEDKGFKEFKAQLKVYQKNDEYNFDDFIEIIKHYNWFIEVFSADVEVFF